MESIALLTEVIEFHGSRGRRAALPEMLLHRGRAFRAIRNDERASVDFESGIAELEAHRGSLPAGEERWGIFHSAEDLFANAIALALDRDDAAKAFEYAERARARALLDAFGSASPQKLPTAPDGTAIVEFAAHANGIVIFVVDGQRVRAVVHPVEGQSWQMRRPAEAGCGRRRRKGLIAAGRCSTGNSLSRSSASSTEDPLALIRRHAVGHSIRRARDDGGASDLALCV